MRDLERRHRAPGGRLEPLEAAHGVLGLAGLVIVAAEDDEVVIGARVEAQVVVGIRGVPEQQIRHRAFRDATADDIRRVEIELRLEERRARDVGLAHQRRVRRKDDVLAGNRAAASLDAERLVDHLVTRRLLEHVGAVPADALGEGAQVLARMKPRLAAEDTAGLATNGASSTNSASKPSSRAQARFFLKRRHVVAATRLRAPGA